MSSGIRNPNATYGYRADDWSSDSLWTLRREQTSDDRDEASAMTSKSVLKKVDRKEIKRIVREGGSLEDYIQDHTDTRTIMSAEKAVLAVMSVKVEGEYFIIPPDYTDEFGKPHPMAGQLIPQPPPLSLKITNPKQYAADLGQFVKWIGVLDADDRSECMEFMTAVWAGRSPEDMKRFQKTGGSVGESSDGGKGPRRVRVSAESPEVPAS